ncbi:MULTISPECIES: phage tail protein [unclassified Microbacterium]|uniref:phage tail protein n=1 Tax=unclassified Microbacterium TaxID=2609290 RepID=UPI00214AC579|nr:MULTISPECIES: phage tail protein [unclassified Microbacterium]MCR2810314.1 phage tail protein [Microbacterium sp. zg.B185]WIM20880.1 phage tail protein [Microbacterium sp. zg-B185]
MLLALVVPLAACTDADERGLSERPAEAEAEAASLSTLPSNDSLLFALQADSGELEAIEGSTDSAFTLTLDHTARQTTWFSDRPARDGGTISTDALVSGWADLGFEDVPPNAVLTVAGGKFEAPLIVELGVPTYDRDSRTMRIAVQLIGRTDDDGIAGSFGAASLFIDNATMNTGCGYTGEIDHFPASLTPEGYVPADGSSVRTANYPELYAVLGDRFGADATTFQMPTVAGIGPDLHALVCATGGIDPAETDPDEQSKNSCIVSQVQLFAQETPVYGFALANGQELPVNQYPALFGYSGTLFGGDGVTTFGTPNLPSPTGTSYQVCTSDANVWSNDGPVGACYLSETGYWATSGTPTNWFTAWTPEQRLPDLLPVSTNQALFSLIGYTYGGDGADTFTPATLDDPGQPLTGAMCTEGQYPVLD